MSGGERVAIVGAGLAGLACARALQDRGLNVTLFEKSRGPGGRTATRRAAPGLTFDHGAQYFTARDPDFIQVVSGWQRDGVVAEWTGRVVSLQGGTARPLTGQPARFVGVPRMNALPAHLAVGLSVVTETRIVSLRRADDAWHLEDHGGAVHGPFASVVVTLPAPQAAQLLADHPLGPLAAGVPMTPCWAALLAFARPVAVPWDGAFVTDSILSWVCRDGSKPGGPAGPDSWVLHATPGWSAAHRDLQPDEALAQLRAEFGRLVRCELPGEVHADAHRWLFSAAPAPLNLLARAEAGVVVCGDWLAGGRVEGAYRSGLAAAALIRGQE